MIVLIILSESVKFKLIYIIGIACVHKDIIQALIFKTNQLQIK